MSRPRPNPHTRFEWKPGMTFFHGGQRIIATEEQGRRFWTVRLPGEWRLRQEFSFVEDAMFYIDAAGAEPDPTVYPA